MRYIGILLIFATALWLDHSYLSFRRRRLAVLEGIVNFLSFLQTELSVSPAPLAQIAKKFTHPALQSCGFLQALSQQGDLVCALDTLRFAFAPGSREWHLLEDFAYAFGKGYRAGEITRTDACVRALTECADTARSTLAKDEKMVHTLCASCSAGIVLLLF